LQFKCFFYNNGVAITPKKLAFVWSLINQFGLFLAFAGMFLLFIEIFIWQPWYHADISLVNAAHMSRLASENVCETSINKNLFPI